MQTLQSLVLTDAPRDQIEMWCRQRTQNYGVSDEYTPRVVARVLGKFLMYLPACDYALTPHLALSGIWEPWVTMAIARHVKPGMRCMDVGACFGYYALLMADIVGAGGHVQAWEPYWHHLLALNVEANGLPIEIIPSPMATISGRMVLGSPTPLIKGSRFFNAGSVSGRMLHADESDPKWLRVKTTAAPPPGPYDFIKVDVEGAEDDVWQALAGVRERSPNLVVCMEFTPSKHTQPLAFLEQITGDGFKLGTIGLDDGYPRACSIEEALTPNTGDFRMLWLTR